MIKITVALAIIGLLAGVVGILVDDYKHPICPKCGDNLHAKRKKGKVVCEIHGDITE